jgi:hypothetical protein
LTDIPIISPAQNSQKDYAHFFEQLLPFAEPHLKSGAWASFQGGASFPGNNYPPTPDILDTLVKRHFSQVSRKDILVPSFGEESCFITATKC